MEKVTIIIPNYNGIKYLPACLDSLKKDVQEAKVPYEVLVVDNGSDDGSRELLFEHYPDVSTILLETNTGFCHAVNVGIQAADGDYVILLNNDTKAFPGFVQNLYDAIKNKRRCFSVSACMLMYDRPDLVDNAGDLYCVFGWAYGRGIGKPATAYQERARVFSACGGAAIYRRSVFDQIGLFDEEHFAYLEDVDLGYRAVLYGYYNCYEPGAKVLHYGSASTGSRYNERKTELASANSVYIIYKNMPALQIVLNAPFLLAGFAIKTAFYIKKGMGIKYVKGLMNGVKRCSSPEGKSHKVPFSIARIPAYAAIQCLLLVNVIRMVRGRLED